MRSLTLAALAAVLAVACGSPEGTDGGTGGGSTGGGAGGGAAGGGAGGAGGSAGGSGGAGGGGTQALEAPALSASGTSPTQVTLSWIYDGGFDAGFAVERAPGDGGSFAARGAAAPTARLYRDDSVVAGETYLYRIRAEAGPLASPYSNVASATPLPLATAAPDAPADGGLLALSDTSLQLTWLDVASNEAAYELQRGTTSTGPFAPLPPLPANATSHVDTGLQAGTAYHYRVHATNAAGTSAFLALGPAQTLQPPAPTDAGAVHEFFVDAGVMRVTWVDRAQSELGYEVQHSLALDGGGWGSSFALPADSTTFIHTGPRFGENRYRVRATSASGGSAWTETSGYAGAILIGYLCPQPTDVAATATSESSVRVNFTFPSTWTCSLVAVERATSSAGPYNEVGRTQHPYFIFPGPPLDAGVVADTGLQPGSTVYYRARSIAIDSQWNGSGYTTPVSVTLPSVLPAPTSLAFTVTSAETASFTFSESAPDETGFAFELATAAAGPWSELFSLPANTTSGRLEGLSPATQYWGRVRTRKGTIVSAPSAAATFTTATRTLLRTTGDATVMRSSAVPANQNVNLSSGVNSVGCFFTSTVDLSGYTYLWHNCAESALRFDTSSLAGRTVLSARLVLTPCALASGSVAATSHVVVALAGPWNPTTVTFNTLPNLYTNGWGVPAPTSGAPVLFDVTATVSAWVAGTLPNHGLYVLQSPIVDRAQQVDQTVSYCSLESNGGNLARAPTLQVDSR